MSEYIPDKAHIPPVKGEFGYYDSRLGLNSNSFINYKRFSHWLINTERKKNVGCFYSLEEEEEYKPFITCQGIIKEVIKQTY